MEDNKEEIKTVEITVTTTQPQDEFVKQKTKLISDLNKSIQMHQDAITRLNSQKTEAEEALAKVKEAK